MDEGDFDAFWDKHTREHPPPHGKGLLAVESAGYACGRGAAWISYDCGTKAAANAAVRARQLTKTQAEEAAVVDAAVVDAAAGGKKLSAAAKKVAAYGVAGACSEISVVGDGKTIVVETFPKNRVGIHVVELALDPSGYLRRKSTRRFDFYNKTDAAQVTFVSSCKFAVLVLAMFNSAMPNPDLDLYLTPTPDSYP